MTRLRGRAPKGQRLVADVPQGHWHVTTVIGAVRLTGPVAGLVFEGATDTAAFATFVEQALVPALRPGDVVVMDNLSSHKAARVREAVEAAQAAVWFLPPYSPDLNPIEKVWSKLKGLLRSAGRRTVRGLWQAIGAAWRQVTASDCRNSFAACGIPPPATLT
jgi:transposase